MAIRCLLWDFGDTLYDELSLWRGSPEWMAVYRSFDEADGVGAAWSLGQLTTEELAQRLAGQLPLTEQQIVAHLGRADLFEPFPFTHAFFHARHLPQAIVTVNPAAFRTLARDLDLDRSCETIVISGEEGLIDKGQLCARALERMEPAYAPSEALLIDNKRSNLDEWSALGGIGYHYRGDDAFREDVAPGLAALAPPR